jgi:hypothetical protein
VEVSDLTRCEPCLYEDRAHFGKQWVERSKDVSVGSSAEPNGEAVLREGRRESDLVHTVLAQSDAEEPSGRVQKGPTAVMRSPYGTTS